jgi:pimeloyl-ACP methyl ester carboxylesterase
MNVTYHTRSVSNVEVFYRQAGPAHAPVLLLLHGFPTAGHMFRDLMPLLATHYRLIAPDLPGFDNLARVMDDFVQALALPRYALYIFDYGAPIGLCMALSHRERVSAIISQNGNAYLEGLSDAWGSWQSYWREPTTQHREACRVSLSAQVIRDWQYLKGADATRVSPDNYTLDSAYMARPGAEEIQLDLILDYRSNVALYPAFQQYFRDCQPPLLAVWGKNDKSFIPPGAEAFRRDLPDAEIRFLDTGHFAAVTHPAEIAKATRDFLGANPPKG